MDASLRPMWRSRVWVVVCVALGVVLLALALIGIKGPTDAAVVASGAVVVTVLVIIWATMRVGRERRDFEHSLTAWAAERAAQQERLRIARELHDLASHGLGLITVRANSVSGLTGAAGDEERRRAVEDIERASRSATSELRRMLTVLRAPGDEVPLQPLATWADMAGIVDGASAFGVSATLHRIEPGEAPASVQAAACAVVRESLTNVGRHAGPVTATVTIDRDADTVSVVIADGGPAPGWRSQAGAGHGIRGMRERVVALGGTLRAEHVGAGFRVEARFPGEDSA